MATIILVNLCKAITHVQFQLPRGPVREAGILTLREMERLPQDHEARRCPTPGSGTNHVSSLAASGSQSPRFPQCLSGRLDSKHGVCVHVRDWKPLQIQVLWSLPTSLSVTLCAGCEVSSFTGRAPPSGGLPEH